MQWNQMEDEKTHKHDMEGEQDCSEKKMRRNIFCNHRIVTYNSIYLLCMMLKIYRGNVCDFSPHFYVFSNANAESNSINSNVLHTTSVHMYLSLFLCVYTAQHSSVMALNFDVKHFMDISYFWDSSPPMVLIALICIKRIKSRIQFGF